MALKLERINRKRAGSWPKHPLGLGHYRQLSFASIRVLRRATKATNGFRVRFLPVIEISVVVCPIGVIGLCAQDFHGDIQVAKASAQTGVPMVAPPLTQDRVEDVVPRTEGTPGLFQPTSPTTKTSPRAS